MTTTPTVRLPDGWTWVSLGQTASVNPGKTETPPSDSQEVSFVPMAAVEEVSGRIHLDQVKRYVEVKKAYTPFVEGDVLFAKITPCMENGKVAVARGLTNGVGFGSTEFHVVRPYAGVSSQFLAYFLVQESFRREARRHMKGTAGQLRVPADFLAEAIIHLPPLAEQHRIVAAIETQFTRLDAAVAALKRAQANLKRYRASVLKAACEGKLVPTEAELARGEGRSYEPAAILLERILKERRVRWGAEQRPRGKYQEPQVPDSSTLPQLPEGWAWTSLPQLGELDRGRSKHRPRDDAKLYGGSYPFIQTGDIRQSGGIIRFHRQTYNDTGLAQSRLWPQGTLCITIAANIGETAILSYPACFPDSVVGFVSPDAQTARFVQMVLQVEQARLDRSASATAQKNINLAVLNRIFIPLPPLAEQQRIVAEAERHLSVIHEAEKVVEANLKRGERLRQSILKRAFEGKLVLQDSRDEPASVLLERIRVDRAKTSSSGGDWLRTRQRRAVKSTNGD